MNFIIGNHILHCQWFSSKWQAHFTQFWENVCHITNHIWKTIVCQVFFQVKNGVPWKLWLVQLATQTVVAMLFLENKQSYFEMQVKYYVCVLPMLSNRILKMYSKIRITKVNYFYWFIKGIMKWNWLIIFFKLKFESTEFSSV